MHQYRKYLYDARQISSIPIPHVNLSNTPINGRENKKKEILYLVHRLVPYHVVQPFLFLVVESMMDQVKLKMKRNHHYKKKQFVLFLPYFVWDEILLAGIFSLVMGDMRYCSPGLTVNILSTSKKKR